MGGSRAVFALDRMYQPTEPEVMVNNLGSLGMLSAHHLVPNWAPPAISASFHISIHHPTQYIGRKGQVSFPLACDLAFLLS